jgi:hypothetical protein
MKSYLKFVFLSFTMICSMFLLASCSKYTLTAEQNITSALAEVMDYFEQNVFDKPAGTDFNTDTSPNYIENSNYYVLVASDVETQITQIQLGKVTYDGGQDYSLAVGNSNTVTRVAYRVDDKKLYIAAPLLFLNAGNDSRVKVCFPKESIASFDVQVYDAGENTLNATVTAQSENVLHVINQNGYEYKFLSDSPNTMIFVVLKQNANVLPTTAKVLIEKIANPAKQNQSQAFTFATPTTPNGQPQNGIELFPGYNGGNSYTPQSPPNHTLIYNIYVVGVGSVQLTLNFENTKQ